MVARGDYLLDHDRDQINLVEGGDVGEYILKITPYMNLLTVPLDNLHLEVKTSYCAMVGTPRSSFFKVFHMGGFSVLLLEIGDIQQDSGGVGCRESSL